MTSIYCSQKLERLIGSGLAGSTTESIHPEFGDWFAHYKSFQRKKCLFLIHIPTYYSIVLADIKKSDILNLKSNFSRILESRLLNDAIIQANHTVDLEKWLGGIQFQKSNNDKKTIGTLNQRISEFQVLLDWHELSFQEEDMLFMNNLINTSLCKPRSGQRRDYISPVKEMEHTIKTLALKGL